jgi:hypothetical protein
MYSGAKVGVGDGTRATVEYTDRTLLNEILKTAGYDDSVAEQIDAVKVATAPNQRNLAGFMSGRLNFVLSSIRQLNNDGKFTEEQYKSI